MRSYIFTAREREVIQAFLEGRIPETGKDIGMIRLRIRTFRNLSSDINLYLKLRQRFAESKTTTST
jgi:hypothetical protein